MLLVAFSELLGEFLYYFALVCLNVSCFGIAAAMIVEFGVAIFMQDKAVVIRADGLPSAIIADGRMSGAQWIVNLWK